MTFRASNILPQEAYQTVKRAAVQLKINLASFNAQLASSGADYDFLQAIYRTLTRADDQFTALKSTQGLAAFAKYQEDDDTYDVVTAFAEMQAAIVGAKAWLDANVPTSVTVKPPADWTDDTMISNAFSPAQTAGLRIELTAVINVIS